MDKNKELTVLNHKQLELCETRPADYSDLRALFLNCTLKRTPELSHTEGLTRISQAIMEKNGLDGGNFAPGRP